jgi:hypothetical protein
VSGTGNLEQFALTDLVASLAPMPVVWMVNPVESPAIDSLIAEKPADAMGFRVEADDEWEQHVHSLISAAACIVIHNGSMTPGVTAEIAAVAAAGRLGDTFFEDAEAWAAGRAVRTVGARIRSRGRVGQRLWRLAALLAGLSPARPGSG